MTIREYCELNINTCFHRAGELYTEINSGNLHAPTLEITRGIAEAQYFMGFGMLCVLFKIVTDDMQAKKVEAGLTLTQAKRWNAYHDDSYMRLERWKDNIGSALHKENISIGIAS